MIRPVPSGASLPESIPPGRGNKDTILRTTVCAVHHGKIDCSTSALGLIHADSLDFIDSR